MKTLHLPPSVTFKFFLFLLVAFGVLPVLNAADKKPQTDGDPYKFKIQGDYWRDTPSITIKGDDTVADRPIDFDKEFGFDTLGTYDFIADWHFTHKQHFIFAATRYTQDKSRAITEDITFRGVTYKAGAVVNAEITNQVWAPAYQYDIMRNERGHLGIPIQINMMDISTKLNGQGVIIDPNTGNSVSGTMHRKDRSLLLFRWQDRTLSICSSGIRTSTTWRDSSKGCTSSDTVTLFRPVAISASTCGRAWKQTLDTRWEAVLPSMALMSVWTSGLRKEDLWPVWDISGRFQPSVRDLASETLMESIGVFAFLPPSITSFRFKQARLAASLTQCETASYH